MTATNFEYHVALSFAGENRAVVEQLAVLLRAHGLSVFYDDFKKSDLWGRDLYQHLDDVYSRQARYCVMFLSEAYARKAWTNHELKAAQSRAFLQKNEAYILPVRLDDTEIPGIRPTMGYLDLRPGRESVEAVAQAVLEKIAAANASAPAAGWKKGKPTDPAGGKSIKVPARKPYGGKNAALVVDNSQDWILLGDTFYKAQSVESPDDTRFVVTLSTADAAEDARLKAIRAQQHPLGRKLPFAFGNDAFVVRCESAPSTFEGGTHKWKVALVKEDVQYGGHLMESSYSNGSQSFTAEDFARMRAERIFLGAHPAPPPNRPFGAAVSDSMVEMFIQGSHNHMKVTGSPIRQLAETMPRTDAQLFLTHARLLTMYVLKAGGVVEQIERLALGPLKTESVHVAFRGHRRSRYSGTAPVSVAIEGDCPLE